MSAAQPLLPASVVLDRKYALLLELGSGATSTVYEAENLRIGKKVALRLMHPAVFSEQDSQSRFIAVARAAARVSHANVAEIYELGVSQNGSPYIVMEMLRGQTVQHLIDARGPLALGHALELFRQVLAGLSAAHTQDIVHSDLKPANVIVTRSRSGRPLAKLLDFGVARGVEAAHQASPMVTGTPMFMAPEQVLGQPVDFRTDVYQACAMLFAMVGSSHPFAANTTRAVPKLVAQGKSKDLKQLVPGLPAELVKVIEAGMAVERAARIQSVEELIERLRPFTLPARLLSLASSAHVSSPVIVSREAAIAQPPRVVIPVHMPRGGGLTDSLLVSPRIPRAPSRPRLQLGESFMPLPGDPSCSQLAQAGQSMTWAPRKRSRRHRRSAMPGLVGSGIGFGLGVGLAWLAGLL